MYAEEICIAFLHVSPPTFVYDERVPPHNLAPIMSVLLTTTTQRYQRNINTEDPRLSAILRQDIVRAYMPGEGSVTNGDPWTGWLYVSEVSFAKT